MAGDWLKMRGNLWDDPRVARMCELTKAREAAIIGALYWLWAAADQHTEDGRMPGLTPGQIDRKTGVRGFASALCEVKWLRDDPDGVVILNFEEHNGASAKRRCSEAKRKGTARKTSADVRTESGHDARISGHDAELEKEKRREEKNQELTSLQATPVLLELPKDGVAAMEIIRWVLQILAPRLQWDDFAASGWLSTFTPDPWLIAAAFCDAFPRENPAAFADKTNPRYFTTVLATKFAEGYTLDNPREYAEHVIRSIQRQRGTAA